MHFFLTLLASRARRQDGQTMAEYAIVLAVISAAIIGALLLLSGNIKVVLSRVSSAIKQRPRVPSANT